MKFLSRHRLAIVWSLILVVLSLMPGKDLPEVDIINFDKVAHLIFYAVFFYLTWIGIKKQYPDHISKAYTIAIIYPISFGIIMEIMQGVLTTDRQLSVADIIANTLGVLLAYLVIRYWKR